MNEALEIRHSGESRNPGLKLKHASWAPASAGATMLAVFAVAFGLYVSFAAPSVTTGDSGEFMTAAATLSLAHPPAYPLYSLMGKSFITLVPFGSVPYRINIFSALVSALTVLCVFLLAKNHLNQTLPAVLLAAAAALCRSFFHNSLITEVFALNTLFVCLILLSIQHRKFLLAAFLLGLGLGNHQILVLMGPALLYVVWKEKQTKLLGAMALCGLIGFSVYAALPIRSRQTPPLNWGQPTTLAKTWRVIRRADYGSLKLATGDQPSRSIGNQGNQVKRFAQQMALEVPWWFLVVGLGGLIFGVWKRDRFTTTLLIAFVLAGPFFFLLGNLPMTAQSMGIMGRFMIWPVLLVLFGFAALVSWNRWAGIAALSVFILTAAPQRYAEGREVRQNRLVYDYGNAMLRSIPPKGALFMDGGDDAFYSLAMLQYVMGRRPDAALHDRGGLIFKNPYGPDFRNLPKADKMLRRFQVEKSYLIHRPVLYSSMDTNLMPSDKQVQIGFLYRITPHLNPLPQGERGIDWPLIVLRGLYPTLSMDEYRVRALAAFFPFMRGLPTIDMASFRQAAFIGHDVDWLRGNLGYTLAHAAYQKLTANRLSEAEALYRQWIELEPDSVQAHANLGVALEKQGRMDEARAQYKQTAERFPNSADPVFNLGVMAWTGKDWAAAAGYFDETLRRDPHHASAANFRDQARAKAKP